MVSVARRVIKPELLDHATPEEAAPSLRDISRINRYLGGHRTLRGMMAGLVQPGDTFSFLDVGAASGDMGAVVRAAHPKARVTSVDLALSHLTVTPGEKVAADAFRLPFADEAFDFVFSSLFLHHFPDDAVVELVRGFARVARRAVLAIDLDRGPLGYYFVPATAWIFGWDAITVHDAPASVNAGFNRAELTELVRRAGLVDPVVRVHRPWSRLSLVGRK